MRIIIENEFVINIKKYKINEPLDNLNIIKNIIYKIRLIILLIYYFEKILIKGMKKI